jgi:hypothetical protein
MQNTESTGSHVQATRLPRQFQARETVSKGFKYGLRPQDLAQYFLRPTNDEAALAQARTTSYLNRTFELLRTSQDAYGGELGTGWTNMPDAAATAQNNNNEHSEEETGKGFDSGVEWSGVTLWRDHSHRRFRYHRAWGLPERSCTWNGGTSRSRVIQHESDVIQATHNYFENGIAHFTRQSNHAISLAAANGEDTAFVGHSAFLRWSTVQDVAFIDPADGKQKIGSESKVSDDFDTAFRLQLVHLCLPRTRLQSRCQVVDERLHYHSAAQACFVWRTGAVQDQYDGLHVLVLWYRHLIHPHTPQLSQFPTDGYYLRSFETQIGIS